MHQQLLPHYYLGKSLAALSILCISILTACGSSYVSNEEFATYVAATVAAEKSATNASQTSVYIKLFPDGSGDYPSLTEALEHAPDGATLLLEAGVFPLTQTQTIRKSIYILGAGIHLTKIASEAPDYVLQIETEGSVAIEGVTIQHLGQQSANVLVIEGGSVHFTDCRIMGGIKNDPGTLGTGLLIHEAGKGIVENCIIEENEESGVSIVGASEFTLKNNQIIDNRIGITLDAETSAVITDNQCNNNITAGINIFSEQGSQIQGNECSGNWRGIVVTGDTKPLLEDNVLKNNAGEGIYYAEQSGGIARKNTCSDNYIGIGIYDQATPRLEINTCNNNSGSGIEYADESGGEARNNVCNGNLIGLYVAETANPNLENNYCQNNQQADLWDGRSMEGASTTPISPDSILFSSKSDIYAIMANGTRLTRLTSSTNAFDIQPKWSPNREMIAFIRRQGTQDQIIVVDRTGTVLYEVIKRDSITAINWSPGGEKIIFVEYEAGKWFSVNLDGTGFTQIFEDGQPALSFDFSPGGYLIAYDRGGYNIIMDQDGGNQRDLITSSRIYRSQGQNYIAIDGHPNWSPDGERIVFEYDLGGDYNIYTINPDGSNLTQITMETSTETSPSWSPNGEQIAFISDRNGTPCLYIINPDGTGLTQLITDHSADPDW